MKVNIIIFLIVVFIAACRNKVETIDPNATGKDFYPLAAGKYYIYDVDSFRYNDLTGAVELEQMQILQTYDSSFLDLQGRESYKVESYKRADSSKPWEFIRADMVTNTGSTIELQEGKARLVKFSFPIRDFYGWDGSLYIDGSQIEWMQDWRLKYFDYLKSFTTNGRNYDTTVNVKYVPSSIINSDTSATSTDEYFIYTSFNEVYAKSIGMVYKDLFFLKKDKAISNYRSGFRAIYKLKEHN